MGGECSLQARYCRAAADPPSACHLIGEVWRSSLFILASAGIAVHSCGLLCPRKPFLWAPANCSTMLCRSIGASGHLSRLVGTVPLDSAATLNPPDSTVA
jgi:hypothetical protein